MKVPSTGKQTFQQKLWLGVTDLLKQPSSQSANESMQFWYSENINVRSDPYAPTLNPAAVKESSSNVIDLLKWADVTPATLTTYLYGDNGYIYSRTTAGSWNREHQVASSHGNGLQYFYGDDYLYYTGDSAIGRYGPLASSPTFSDDFLTAQGGAPQNTNSIALVAASSQYLTAADSASLSQGGNLTLEAYCYLNSLPSVGNSMVIIGKWDESGALRSYVMDIYAVSGYFGDGSDGALTISGDTTEAPIDSACTGTASASTLAATNASFAIGQQIFIHQTQGANAGQWERNVIDGYTAGTITLRTPLLGTYVSGAQVRVLKQYTTVTVNGGVTYSAKAWNGTTGGILAFLANGLVTITGTINANGKGYRGGASPSATTSYQGEGTTGLGSPSNDHNATGGGGSNATASTTSQAAGGGGGHANTGSDGIAYGGGNQGVGGLAGGTTDLTTMIFGGAGGAGRSKATGSGGIGGNSGGIVFITAAIVTVGGAIAANGDVGASYSSDGGGGGGGSGGAILLKVQTATLGASLMTASGGSGGAGYGGANGGTGSDGRIHLDYLTSYTGTTTPTLNPTQDNTLVTTATYQLRLGISNDGTAYEYLTKNLSSLSTGQFNRFSITWTAASSLATFYQNASSLGTSTGTKTSIHDNASLLYVGAKKGASVVGSFFDGYIDDVRLWSAVQSAGSINARNNVQLTGSEGGIQAYYKLNGSLSDSTANANDLTQHGGAGYTSTVPFVDPTTRLDIDQSYTTTGSTYAVPTAISEATADQLPFTPSIDSQKSMDINISGKGTGNWTITIHDQTNRTIASKTISNASMASSGYQEFSWDTPWRIVIGKSYHAHITSTVNDGTIVTSSVDVLQTGGNCVADFHTYFSFLVTDALFHPVIRWLNFLVIGNERYLAKWDGAFYDPNYIAFPQGTHVRCFGIWANFLVIGTWQEAASGTPNIYDFPTGKLYFWDGISLTFNFQIDVPEGQVNAMFGMDRDLYYFAGFKGDLFRYQGGAMISDASNGQKIKRIPYLERTKYVEVYPQSLCNFQGMLYFGIGANTNSSALPQGVYSWGSLYPSIADNLVFEHIISTGNKGSSVKIGMIYPVGQKLLVGWKDGLSYGCDVIDPTAGVYYTQGLIQTNIQDGGDVWHDTLLFKVRADHSPLASGEGVTVGYKKDRGAAFVTTESITDPKGEDTAATLSGGRLAEFQLEAILTGNGFSSPTLLQLGAQYDPLREEMAY